MSAIGFLKGIKLFRTGLPRVCSSRSFCSDERPDEKKGLILGVYEGENEEPVFSKAVSKFNDHLGGKLMELVKTGNCEIKKGQGRIFNNIDKEFWSVALVGLGKEKAGYCEMEAIDEGLEAVREAAGKGAQLLKNEYVSDEY